MFLINYLYLIVFLINSSVLCSSSHFFAKQSFLLQTGFSNIAWDYIESSDFQRQNVSLPCKSGLSHVIKSANLGHHWSLQLLEASGRNPTDFTSLGYIDHGDYSQCLALDWINSNGLKETGKYCLTSLLPNENQNLYTKIYTQDKVITGKFGYDIQIGFCLPSSCSSDDLNIIFTNAIKPYSWDLFAIRNCEVKSSFTKRLANGSTLQKICLAILVLIIINVLYATYLDKNSNLVSESAGKSQWFKHFSMFTSYRQVVEPNWSSDKIFNLIICAILLHSIVLSMHTLIWPLITKTFPLIAISSQAGLLKDSKLIQYMNTEWINEGIFVYGGIARSLDLWKHTGLNSSLFRLLINVFIKFISLSILMSITMFVQISLPLFITGPSDIVKYAANACEKSFFKVIFQSSHWITGLDESCVLHYWSVCVECHYLVLLVILIYLYKRHQKTALSLNILILIGSLLYVGITFYQKGYPTHGGARGLNNFEEMEIYAREVYIAGSMHLWMYMTTTLCTYLIMNHYHRIILKISLFKIISQNLQWFAVILTFAPALYSYMMNFQPTRLTDAVYVVFYRIMVLIFYSLCIFQQGESIAKFFNHKDSKGDKKFSEVNNNDENIKPKVSINPRKVKFYHIISTILRSSYCIHVPVMITILNSLHEPIFTVTGLYLYMIAQIIFSLIGGFLFHIFIIGPMTSILVTSKKVKSH